MIRYYKRTLGTEVIAMGYMDEENEKNMLFQTFKEVDYSELSEIDLGEFRELAKKYDFYGMKPKEVILPSSFFSFCAN